MCLAQARPRQVDTVKALFCAPHVVAGLPHPPHCVMPQPSFVPWKLPRLNFTTRSARKAAMGPTTLWWGAALQTDRGATQHKGLVGGLLNRILIGQLNWQVGWQRRERMNEPMNERMNERTCE